MIAVQRPASSSPRRVHASPIDTRDVRYDGSPLGMRGVIEWTTVSG